MRPSGKWPTAADVGDATLARAPSARGARATPIGANAPRSSAARAIGHERTGFGFPITLFALVVLDAEDLPPFDTSVREGRAAQAGTSRTRDDGAAPLRRADFFLWRVSSASSSDVGANVVVVRAFVRGFGPRNREPRAYGGLPKPPRTNVSDGGAGRLGRRRRRGDPPQGVFPSFSKPSPSIASPLAALSRSSRALASSAEAAGVARRDRRAYNVARAAARRMASGSSSTRRAFGHQRASFGRDAHGARLFDATYAAHLVGREGLRALVYARVDAAQVALELAPGARGEDRPRGAHTRGGLLTKTPSRARSRARSASSHAPTASKPRGRRSARSRRA